MAHDKRAVAAADSDGGDGSGAALFKKACEMGLEGIVSKRALSAYRSGPSKFWLKTKNVVESELILLGTDCDNEGKPIAHLGKETEGQLRFVGTAFLTLSGAARSELQKRIEKLVTGSGRLWRSGSGGSRSGSSRSFGCGKAFGRRGCAETCKRSEADAAQVLRLC